MSRRFCIATLLGIILGKINLIAIVAIYEITFSAGRIAWPAALKAQFLVMDMVNLLHRLFGWFTVPEIRDYWPFYW